MADKPRVRQRSPYGFRYNIHRKSSEIGIRWEWLEKIIGRTFEIIARYMLVAIMVTVVAVSVMGFFFIDNPKRGVYMGLGLILMLISLLGFLLMNMLSDLSSGTLINQAITLHNFKARNKRIAKGKDKPLLDTSDGYVDDEGYLYTKHGEVGRLLLVDGLTNPSNFPEEAKAQEERAKAWQRARPRDVYEIKISTIQPQNTKRQVRELNRRGRLSDRQSVKALVKQQATYLSKRVEGVIPTTVQYILVKAQDKRMLDSYIDLMDSYVEIGLYYGITKQNKAQTEELLTEIRQFI